MKNQTSAVKGATAEQNASTNKKIGMSFNRRYGNPVILLMSMPNPNAKAIAVLDMPRTWGDRTQIINSIMAACNNTTLVTFLTGELTGLAALVFIFTNANDDVDLKKLGAVAARKTAYENVVSYLNLTIKFRIQQTANANQGTAISIIQSCLFKVKTYTTPVKTNFAVYSTQIPSELKGVGNVKAMALSAGKETLPLQSAFYMQSTDGVNWEPIEGTLGAKATFKIAGFPIGTTLFFRVMGNFSKNRKSAWFYSGPVTVK